MSNRIVRFFSNAGASMLYLGYIPGMPGTIGSAAATGVVWYLHMRIPEFFTASSHFPAQWLLLCAAAAAALGLIAGALGGKTGEDPPCIVIDECAGQLVTFFMLPITWRTLLLGFLLFRLFDIVKPYPVCRAEEIEGPVGILADDLVAGVLANICIHLIIMGYSAVSVLLTS
jgi:phosphatidylglycerophosphatase A